MLKKVVKPVEENIPTKENKKLRKIFKARKINIRKERISKNPDRQHNQQRRFANRELTILDPTVSSIINLGNSNGRSLGFYLPPGTVPSHIGLEQTNAIFHRDFIGDPRNNGRTQRIHKNGLDDYTRKQSVRNSPLDQFYRLLRFGEGPHAFTRLYNNNKQNITPINGGFGGTLIIPTYTRYHSTPSNNLIQLIRPGGRRNIRANSYHVTPEKLEALRGRSRPLARTNLYGRKNQWYNTQAQTNLYGKNNQWYTQNSRS